jgi:hypothetical protein
MLSRGFLAMVVLMPTAALAHTIAVPADQPTIQAGIDAAAHGDTVLVAGGTYAESGLQLTSGVTLRGAPDAVGTVVIDGQQQGRVIACDNVQDVVIENLVIVGGEMLAGVWIEDAGAGLRCLQASVRLTDCRFAGNRASVGGGLAIRGSTVVVERCVFVDNHAQDDYWAPGGGIYSRDSSGSVRDCTFDDNTAFSDDLPGDGGGFFTHNSTLEITDCTFHGNATGAGGGGFYSYDQDLSQLVDCAFTENTAVWAGAAFFELSQATLTRCAFTGNTATSGAGAIETLRSENVFIDCEFIGNTTSSQDGGAIQSWEATLTLEGCLFRTNAAVSGAGALWLGGVTAVLRDCVFQDNVARRGGAIRCHYATPELTGCTFVGNRGTIEGAAIHVGTASGAVLDRCIIAFSPEGASISAIAGREVTLSCTDIFGNAGGDWVALIADQAGQSGNLSADPQFCDVAAGDLHIFDTSPCAATNSGGCGLIGALPIGCSLVGVHDVVPAGVLTMAPAVPNPFNPATTIRFALAQPAFTGVVIVDLAGRRVRTLTGAFLPAGPHELVWDGRDDAGLPSPAGVYHAVATSGAQRASTRLALVK